MQEQLDDLQIRFAHQEVEIEALQQAVLRQDQAIRALKDELARVRELLRDLRPSPLDGDAVDEPPPPHY